MSKNGDEQTLRRANINDDELVRMYNNDVPIPDLMAHFNINRTVIYKHLKKAGATHRRCPVWTQEEEAQLIAARNAGCTGQEYEAWIPTRSLPAIKGHLIKMRMRGARIR